MDVVERSAGQSPQAPAAGAGGASDIQDLILSCNKDGMENLRNGQDKAAFEQFKYAEAILLANQMEGDNTALLAVTCNNLGCYYKKAGKFHGALSYLRRALKIEVELNTDEVTLAGTHLNLCAILSKLEKHAKAVQHALCALELMSKVVTASDTGVMSEDYTVLAIAYHNVGMEREFLGQWDQAATAFQNGFQVAKRLLGENHPLSITLEKNCEAVLKKTKLAKTRPRQQRGAAGEVVLPPVTQGREMRQQPESPQMATRTSVHKEALDWVRSEEMLWASFAQKTLHTDDTMTEREAQALSDAPEAQALRPQPLTTVALRELPEVHSHEIPRAYDMGAFRFEAKSPRQLLKKTQMGQALDSHPEALMDIIEADGDGPSMRSAPNDFRPNRSMKRSTRTSRVVRRTGVFNSTTHRDRVEADLQKKRANDGAPWKSAHVQKLAAERIQRVWRSWYQYCQENSEWVTITWICATMIQSHWRSYHVRRMRMDGHARTIQRHCRGFLVRNVLKNHTAAVTIQRRVVGMITRKRLKGLHSAASDIQRLVRGGLARKHFKEHHQFKTTVAVTIQKHVRVWLAKRVASKMAQEKRERELMLSATLDLQRMYRGWKGRHLAEERRQERERAQREYDAATRLQSALRARRARKRVDELRELRLRDMEKAATFVRKAWLGARTRKKYLQLQREFSSAEDKILTMQRYLRGCMCRLKLWREAVRTEEELWAVVEIQRCWRGYRGRVAWEDRYEQVWRREMSAALLQRNMRGWHARLCVGRMKRKLARAEFERARQRFRAAQKMQALARGVSTRRATDPQRTRARKAATDIQRHARGHALRSRMWKQVVNQRATMITALARGFLVRNRRLRLIATVICIQRAYRRWLRKGPEHREEHYRRKQLRSAAARKVQRHWRQYAEHREIRRIQAASLGPLDATR
mmetsp:Transcript_22345/g.69455  ORF Transcript_22345/g.69455 Transcript_22345/m.69455 type:complete len:926 (-) Transcript_22345:139-2916(-)